MSKTITFATLAHLKALSSDIEGRDENRRDDMRSVELEAEDETLICMGLAIDWLRALEATSTFPLTIRLADAPQVVADEIDLALEQVEDGGLYDEEGDDLSPLVVGEDEEADLDWRGHDLFPADWTAMLKVENAKPDGEQMRVADALAIAARLLRRTRDLTTPVTYADGTPNPHRARLDAACGVIQGLRAQRGCEEQTPDAVEDLTHLCDIIIFG